MKVLLLNVSKHWEGRTYKEYPYGIGILATLAEQAGYIVHILDMAVDCRDYKDIVDKIRPDVIAVSFLSPSVQLAAVVISTLKSDFGGSIIAGGIHSTLYPEAVLGYGADIVMLGEGELTFVSVLDCLNNAEYQSRDSILQGIPGLVYQDSLGNICWTKTQDKSVDLDNLPIMNRDLFDLSLYSHHTILTSRCCPYQCNFCCSWAPGGKMGRIMSSERILLELEWLVEHYGALMLYWGDEIFFWNKEERLRFCKLLQKKQFPIKFIMQIRADLVDVEIVEELKAAGCIKICIGAEAGSDRLLKTANKKITAAQIERAIDVCVKAGLSCKTWWMVGLPGGGKEDQLMALDIIERTRPNEVAVHQFVPLPGSNFWDNAEQYGLFLPEEASFENLNYYGNPEKLLYDYISGEELYEILKIYEKKLLQMGYIPTDQANESSDHVFTTPFQKNTFNV
ncbi:MAG: B12-binding domain-containing radical SAM protein [Lachnospiraceae bacterium]|nr:B12-binding domain-containing radical SAM protein [Lachnospiraceae bacterium]